MRLLSQNPRDHQQDWPFVAAITTEFGFEVESAKSRSPAARLIKACRQLVFSKMALARR
jgi:hypothetical protein